MNVPDADALKSSGDISSSFFVITNSLNLALPTPAPPVALPIVVGVSEPHE